MWSAELADEVTGGGDGDLMEMPRHGKHRKTKSRFPDFSTALGNRFRDSHIPTAPAAIHLYMAAEAEGRRSGILLGWRRPGYNYGCPASFLWPVLK